MADQDGGPAFPSLDIYEAYDRDRDRYAVHSDTATGMSLRDYFAAQALPQAIAHALMLRAEAINPGDFDFARVAASTYAMADAMLKARKQ